MNTEAPKITAYPIGGRAREIISRDVKLMARSYMRQYPLIVKRVKGAVVEDLNGNLYIDLTSGFGTLPLGGLNPEVVKSIIRQAENLPTYSLRAAYSEDALELVEELSRIVPIRGDVRAIFVNSGSEAMDAALRSIIWHTDKKILLSFIGAYHGSTLATSSISFNGSWIGCEAGFMKTIHIPYPYCFRCPLGLDLSKCGTSCLTYLEDVISRIGSQKIASIVLEPIQVEAGVIVPPRNYIEKFLKMIGEKKILLTLDEVSTAPGRSGRWFAAEHWNLDADVICLGPQLSSGLPLGIVLARESILDLEPETFESTTGGCQLSIVSALTTLRIIRDEGLVERAERLGRNILKKLNDLKDEVELIGDVRGLGLMIGLEFTGKLDLGQRLAKILVKECFRSGLIVRRRFSTIILTPPLNIDEELLEKGLEIFEAKLRELWKDQRHKRPI
ncbi:MAG: aminotransferase class III-fold pyridoxal phosphate-dependent enzyme [Thaumarchaeota archaeon]|nr:aminotransferase class III-fold pyridoxal phosphate-dependent enzyme [Nitrososphaerota archaeon]